MSRIHPRETRQSRRWAKTIQTAKVVRFRDTLARDLPIPVATVVVVPAPAPALEPVEVAAVVIPSGTWTGTVAPLLAAYTLV